MARAYLDFLREFPVDLLHVCEAWGGRQVWDPDGSPRPDRDPAQVAAIADSRGPFVVSDVDRHYDTVDCQPWLESGMFDHVQALTSQVGKEIMIFPNMGGPCGELGSDFEDRMVRVFDGPDDVHQNLLSACRGSAFARVKASRLCGADGFIFSLGYGGAMDLISPALTRRIHLDPWIEFFDQIRRIGMFPVGYFLGNVLPYMDIIMETRPAGVLIEESKKGFNLDPVAIRKRLPSEIVLFGNVDSLLLLNGTPHKIEAEVRRQARARDYGPFVFDNGSPICPGTPPDNLRAFLDAARSA